MSDLCEVCGSNRVRSTEIRRGLVYLVCAKCGHALLNTTGESLRARFEASQRAYFGEDALMLDNPDDPFGQDMLKKRVSMVRAFLPPAAALTEVGPGGGAFLSWAVNNGFAVTAVEESAEIARSLKSSVGVSRVLVGEFETLPLDTDSQDAFCSFHVIEHVPSPTDHLARAIELVKPGGVALVATPNSRSWEHRFFESLSPNFDSAHLRVFSAESLSLLAKRVGWEVERLDTPEYASCWLRVASKWLRRRRGQDEEATAGIYGSGLSARTMRVLRLYAGLSLPIRSMQTRMLAGNEVFAVLRKPA